ncbi:MAG TPA: hypothetical protein VM389_12170, partial [Phycisphaerae bacterium]|nr:hypothetical protein [Phycisphaerae bacterium]
PAPAAETVRPEAAIPRQTAVKVILADTDARQIRTSDPQTPVLAARVVRSAKAPPDSPRGKPVPAELRIPGAPAPAQSLARPADTRSPVPPADEKTRPGALVPEPADLEVAVRRAEPSPISTTQPVTPLVAEHPVRTAKLPTASPHGKPTGSDLAVPSAQVIPRSLLVVASFTPREAPQLEMAAANLPSSPEATEIRLPAARAQQRVAERVPVPDGLPDAPPLERRTLSALAGVKLEEALAAREAPPPVERVAESLANQPLSHRRQPRPADAVGDRIAPQALLTPLFGSLGPGRLKAPPSLFHRSFEQRQRLINKMGGSKESEAAVARALTYLARNQESDGRWTYFVDGRRPGKRPRHGTEAALTGLTTLCFLAADHTPAKPGPYREAVTKALDYLVATQKPDGDLRGHGGRMYGHAIATLALAEAATMTGDPRCRQAAVKGAEFIVKAQDPRGGGWRYNPREPGDTSVVGWQVMALHSVTRLGVEIPDKTRKGAFRWLDRASGGKHKMLAGYQGPSPTPVMTAEAVFARILLGQQLSQAEQAEAGDYLLKHPPDKWQRNFYYWYYASLALMQMQNEAWSTWNAKMREHLIKLQRQGGNEDGSWDIKSTYGPRGGRVYTTALATLTLEVYYRYLPMYSVPGGSGSPK